MSTSKLEMSLDDIIKANKNKSKMDRSNGSGAKHGNNKRSPKKLFKPKGGRGIAKRGNKKVGNNSQNRNNKVRNSKPGMRNSRANNKVTKATTVATKKLVQKLVKKALAQRTLPNTVNVARSTPIRKRGGVRIIKKTVVLNRLNTKSRIIGRRRGNAVTRTTPVRRQIRYNTQAVQYVSAAPVAVQRKFIPRQTKIVRSQPVIVQQAPQRRRNQGRAPVFQLVQFQNRGNTVRSQINALRRQNGFFAPQVQQQRPQFRQKVAQVNYIQQPQQQQRRRFQNRQQRPQQHREVFYEPQSFLQRIPVQQTNRRFIN